MTNPIQIASHRACHQQAGHFSLYRRGTVDLVCPHYMLISLDQTSSCTSCSQGTGCGAGIFSSIFSGYSSQVKIARLIECRAGDTIELEIPSTVALKMAFVGYCVPVLSMMIFAMVCQYSISSDSIHVAVSGFLGLIAGLVGGVFAYPLLSRYIIASAEQIIQIRLIETPCAELSVI